MSRRVRRIAMWTGLAAGLAIAAAWFVSGWRLLWWERSAGPGRWVTLGLAQGQASIAWGQGPAAAWTPWYGRFFSRPQPLRWSWGYGSARAQHPLSGTINAAWIPLWPAFVLAVGPSAILCVRLRRPAPGCCRCGYSLSGISAAQCPECGRAL